MKLTTAKTLSDIYFFGLLISFFIGIPLMVSSIIITWKEGTILTIKILNTITNIFGALFIAIVFGTLWWLGND